MRTGKCRSLPDNPDGKLEDPIEAAKVHVRDKVEHPFRVIKPQQQFQKTRLRGMANNRWKLNVLAARANLFLARRHLLAKPSSGELWTKWAQVLAQSIEIKPEETLNRGKAAYVHSRILNLAISALGHCSNCCCPEFP